MTMRARGAMKSTMYWPTTACRRKKGAELATPKRLPQTSPLSVGLRRISLAWTGPHQMGELYRVRWEIEVDNKVDKAGARLDEISARTPVGARILVLATLLDTTIARTIVQREKLTFVAAKKDPSEPASRAPLHPILLMPTLASVHFSITDAERNA